MIWGICAKNAENDVIKFLETWDNEIEPPISLRERGITGIVESMFEKGNILITKHGNKIIGLIGYEIDKKGDKRIHEAYIDIALVNPFYRGIFQDGLRLLVDQLERDTVTDIRWHTTRENISRDLHRTLGNAVKISYDFESYQIMEYRSTVAHFKKILSHN